MVHNEEREIRELKKITEELRAVNANTGSSWVAFFRGILQGGGAVVGSIIAIILIGVLLSILGFIPGFHTIATYIGSAASHVQR
jgi:hypothetical protein